ncbi:MAG: MarR family transcriptional regulator [Thermoflavifilum sp.]|nr:MarR family transcriptional regulator [Thermoflavifilum sp.]MCL6514620.1 MarR family transcriptional regulator [Alicyclobacillus sp.]
MAPMDAGEHRARQLDELMARLHRLMTVKSDHASLGLTASQVFILRYLDRCDVAKASDIARVSGLSPGAVTQVCDELVRQGLVQRERSTDDRRVVHIRITGQGRDKLEQIRKLRMERMKGILDKLDPDDLDHFLRTMHRIIDIVEETQTPGGSADE